MSHTYERNIDGKTVRIIVNSDWSGVAEVSVADGVKMTNRRAALADASNLASGLVYGPKPLEGQMFADDWAIAIALASEKRAIYRKSASRRRSRYLRYWLFVNRLPAIDQMMMREFAGWPVLYADYQGKRVRVTMASRIGDVGITENLDAADGYTSRVPVSELSNFGDLR